MRGTALVLSVEPRRGETSAGRLLSWTPLAFIGLVSLALPLALAAALLGRAISAQPLTTAQLMTLLGAAFAA